MQEMRRKAVGTHVEDGTSILELLEFTIAGNLFGINVAKVTEIMQYRKLTPMASSHPSIEGVFKPRDKIITVVNLPYYMGLAERENSERDMLMLTNFSNMDAAFHVHTVEAMHRIKWSDVEKPDATVYGGMDSLVTGNAKIGSKLVTVIDFERVLFDISPATGLQLSEIAEMGSRERSEKPIVIAEDSVFLQRMLIEAMEKAGYSNVRPFNNGRDAWEYLEKASEDCVTQGIPIESKVAAVITDIEMPRMDGHHLTKLIKSEKSLGKLPVIVFSSLIDESMQTRGEALGVDAHLSKPQIGMLVATLDRLIL
ncbi:MAG: chemotaxis protein [Oscillospiraceae bacterium]|jgi:two-component system chemotaxis response regulator CheV|nr:chemotaxis protein [Oscillospiraceae bacterium]